ncbi:putative uncharacterized protein DDB_G0282133 [Neocloeon triangulifer]|uniref:putative uncharacterized protein DDB_G0282133 n=1 Tax=Neocloeon triangulifer TaxID=2078957 RepID=UPI00286F8B5A|nr:putative uncharacterized protein DDB_G0282133 [Neocloeon triangulifer]
MKSSRLLALLAVCIASAKADSEPITTPFIPCKALTPLKTLALQQLTGQWAPKKLYAVSEVAALVGMSIAKPGQQCLTEEISQVQGPALVLSVFDSTLDTKNSSSCSIDRSQHGLWTCSPMGKGGFNVVVVMAEASSFLLLAPACVSAKHYPNLQQFEPQRFSPVLFLLQKKNTPALAADKIAEIDQKAGEALQRRPIIRDIDCTENRAGFGGQLNGINLNEFEDSDVGIDRPGFVNANENKGRPIPSGRPGSDPHFGPQGGSTVLKPGVTYANPSNPIGNSAPLNGKKQFHKHPEVNRVMQSIQEWFNDPRNKKNGQHGGGSWNQGGNGGLGNNNNHNNLNGNNGNNWNTGNKPGHTDPWNTGNNSGTNNWNNGNKPEGNNNNNWNNGNNPGNNWNNGNNPGNNWNNGNNPGNNWNGNNNPNGNGGFNNNVGFRFGQGESGSNDTLTANNTTATGNTTVASEDSV